MRARPCLCHTKYRRCCRDSTFPLLPSWLNPWGSGRGQQGKPLFPLSPPGDCCTIANSLMANAQSMLRTQLGAAAYEKLDAAAARVGEGLGSPGGWMPGSSSSWFLSGAF